MTPEHINVVCTEMSTTMGSRTPKEASEACKDGIGVSVAQSFEMADHVAYMLQEIPILVAADRREKAMRWLGFAQCWFVCMGLLSITDLKSLNTPRDGEG